MPDDLIKLVEAAKGGDRNAFGEIYRLYLTRIYRFVYYLVSDSALAEDITQDTFVKAWKALPGFSVTKGTFQAFLYRIARNSVIDIQRKKKEFSLEDTAGRLEGKEDPEKDYLDKEEKRIAKDALSKLDPDEKEIVMLRFFEELSYGEISNILGKQEGGVRVQVHRILAKLRSYLDPEKPWK